MKSIIFYFKLLYPKCDIIFEITLNYTITAWNCHFLFFSVSKLNLMMRCSIVSAALKTVWWVTFYSLVSKLNLMIRCCIASADLKTVWELLDVCSWSVHFRDGVLSPLHKLHIHSLFTRLIFYMYSYLWQQPDIKQVTFVFLFCSHIFLDGWVFVRDYFSDVYMVLHKSYPPL